MSIHPPLGESPYRSRKPGGARSSPVLQAGLGYAAILGVLLLCAGLAWRAGGRAPGYAVLFEGVDIALWLSALLLAPAFELNLGRLLVHNPPLRVRFQHGLQGAAELTEAGLALGLAALGMLAAYPAGGSFVQLETIEGVSQPVPFGAYILMVMLLAAPGLVLASSAILLVARRLAGNGYGTIAWAVVAMAVHAPLLGAKLPGDAFTTVGGYSAWLINLLDSLANQAYPSMYLIEIISRVLAAPLLLAAAAWLVLAVYQALANNTSPGLPVTWTAPAAGLLASAGYGVTQALAWTGDPAQRFPGSYEILLGCGLSVALVVRLLGAWADGQPSGAGRFNREMVWLALAGMGLVSLTEPAIRAGQGGQLEILAYGLACLLVLLSGAVAAEWLVRSAQAYPWAGFPLRAAFLFLVIVPVGPRLQPPALQLADFMARSVLVPEELVPALLFAVCIAAIAAFAWISLFTRRSRRPGRDQV